MNEELKMTFPAVFLGKDAYCIISKNDYIVEEVKNSYLVRAIRGENK